MDMPSDFTSKEKKKTRGSKLWILLPVGVLSCVLVYFMLAPHSADRRAREAITESAEVEEEFLAAAPPQEEYEFYEILSAEKPQLFSRNITQKEESRGEYLIFVEYFLSYDRATERGEDLRELGIERIKIEPFGKDLRFRLRLGPYPSRSGMNAVRDILYHNEIPHRLLHREK